MYWSSTEDVKVMCGFVYFRYDDTPGCVFSCQLFIFHGIIYNAKNTTRQSNDKQVLLDYYIIYYMKPQTLQCGYIQKRPKTRYLYPVFAKCEQF